MQFKVNNAYRIHYTKKDSTNDVEWLYFCTASFEDKAIFITSSRYSWSNKLILCDEDAFSFSEVSVWTFWIDYIDSAQDGVEDAARSLDNAHKELEKRKQFIAVHKNIFGDVKYYIRQFYYSLKK